MAEAARVGLEDEVVKDKFLSCSICLERFNSPKVLPCLHTFCLLCLDSYIDETSKDGEFLCPSCRETTKTPLTGAVEFKTNFFVNSLVDFFWGKDIQHPCSICALLSKTSPSVSKCMDCSDYLCAACSASHCLTRSTLKHSVVSLEDIYSEQKLTVIAAKRTVPCSEHPDENVRYFCTMCEKPVCRDCKALSHQDHKSMTFQEAIQERKPILREKIERLTGKYQQVQSELVGLEKYHENIQKEHKKFVEEVERIYKAFLDSLLDFKSRALQNGKTRTEQILKQCNMALEETKSASAQLYSYKGSLETTLERAADVEILDTFKMSTEHLENLCEEIRPSSRQKQTLGQYTSANSRNIKQFLSDCQKCLDNIRTTVRPKHTSGVLDMASSFVRKLPSPVVNSLWGTGLVLCEDGDLYACWDGKVYQYCQGWVAITSELDVRDVSPCDMLMDGDTLIVSTYSRGTDDPCGIIYYNTTTKTSQTIKLDFDSYCPCICLRQDSSTMYVTDCRHKQLREINRNGSTVKFTSCDFTSGYPAYVTQCKDGNIFVSDRYDRVHIFNRDLELVKTVNHPSIKRPRGLQADDTGNVYVADEGSDAVYLLSSDGTLSRTVLCDKDGIESPWSLSLSSDELAVGDAHGVWIYTLQ